MKKETFVIQLENDNFAKLEHEIGTHVCVDEVEDLSEATHFDSKSDAEHYLDDFKLFKKNGFGYQKIDNSKYQYHRKFSDLKEVKTVHTTYQIVDEELQDQRNVIHDCYVDVNSKVPTEEQIKAIAEQIPERIKILAKQWGWSDTEVREFTYCFIRDELSL